MKERFARLREAVDPDPHAAGREERVSFEGQYYKTEKATIYDRPDTPVPIYVAGRRRLVVATMPAASRDGFICTSGRSRSSTPRRLLPKVAEGIAASERRHRTPTTA